MLPRIYAGELVSTLAALALIPVTVVFDWYGLLALLAIGLRGWR